MSINEQAIERVDSALVRVVAAPEQIVESFKQYQQLQEKLLTPDDFQQISGKAFKKRSAWRKLALAFGVSFEIRKVEIDRDEAGRVIEARVLARAVAPNGRFADGWGACSIHESRFDTNRQKPEHDIPATAETRAKNRAAADLFGFGEVSAEEVVADEPDRPARNADEPCTEAQRKKLYAVTKELGLGEDYVKKLLKTRFGVDSSKQLTKQQISSLIDDLEASKTRPACSGDSERQ